MVTEASREIGGLSDPVRELVRDMVAFPRVSRSFSTRSATSRSLDETSTGLNKNK